MLERRLTPSKPSARVGLSPALLSQILDALSAGVIVVDADGAPIFSNRRARELLGIGAVAAREAGPFGSTYPVYVAGTNTPYPVARLPVWRALRGDRGIIWDAEVKHPKGSTPLILEAAPLRTNKDGIVLAAVVILETLPTRAAA